MAAGTDGVDDGGLLRVLACGSVDDGKSTLIGRLLYETGHLNADEIAHVEEASRKRGRKVLRRDLRIQSIFLIATGQIKMGDFGITWVQDAMKDHA